MDENVLPACEGIKTDQDEAVDTADDEGSDDDNYDKDTATVNNLLKW